MLHVWREQPQYQSKCQSNMSHVWREPHHGQSLMLQRKTTLEDLNLRDDSVRDEDEVVGQLLDVEKI